MNLGVCRNVVCAKSLSGELIDRYPGPGQFCPDCGELLQSAPNGRATVVPPDNTAPRNIGAQRSAAGPENAGLRSPAPSNGAAVVAPAGPAASSDQTGPAQAADDDAAANSYAAAATAADLTGAGEKASERTAVLEPGADHMSADCTTAQPAAEDPTVAGGAHDPFATFRNEQWAMPAEHQPGPPAETVARRVPPLAVIALIAVVGLALVFILPATMRANVPLRICGSSATARLAGDLLAAYTTKDGGRAANSSVVSSGPCDVQFAAVSHPGAGTEIARDGVVVVVHPQNPITRLSDAQFRRIVSGEITDWSQLGGPRGTIFIVLPAESTDERRAIAQTTLRGTRVASRVLHVGSSAEIVRLVSGASGRRWLGVVAFSAAVPAKVLPLGTAPTPSAVTIANNRYPLTLDVTVKANDERNSAAESLIAFARSQEAEAIVARDGFVARAN